MGLRAGVQIPESHIIPEAADKAKAKSPDNGHEAFFGEVSVSHDETTDGKQPPASTGKHPGIPAGEKIGIVHALCAFGPAAVPLVGECLFRFKEYCVIRICIHDGDSEYLEASLHRSRTAGPEPVKLRCPLPGLGDVTRIDGYCDAMSLR